MRQNLRTACLLGYSNSGKTTFIEAVLRECAARGISAATVKKSRHQADLAQAAKDSERFFAAGASPSIYLDESSMLVLSRRPADLDAEQIAALCPAADLILCEGLELRGCPLVLVAGGAAGPEELKRGLDAAAALVAEAPGLTEAAACAGIPCFTPGESARFLDWLLSNMAFSQIKESGGP
jgi:molybdopterin-guanine dinucleotide biosynthesis protein B